MAQVTPIRDLKSYLETEQVERLIAAATNPRDKAFIALLIKSGIRISEATQLKTSDIDFQKRTLTIIHLKERLLNRYLKDIQKAMVIIGFAIIGNIYN